jgi:hypothetical protein
LHGGEPSLGANVDNDLVSVSEQRFGRSMSKPVSGAGDEDTSRLVGVHGCPFLYHSPARKIEETSSDTTSVVQL